jgi:DNA invertase Pin-like site-specific DNA recombinase
MSLIGYARVSSTDQDLTVQLEALRAAGCERIFQEKRSGRSADDRAAWQECLDFLRDGDVLMFTRLDRVGRSLVDLVNIGAQLQAKNVEIRCLQQPVDTTTAEGRLLWGILATVAEFEVDIKRARQREGIERAKREGKYTGGKPKVTRAKIEALKAEGLGASAIARKLGCDRTTVYRAHPEGWGDAPIGA